jgi:hypothetical protein
MEMSLVQKIPLNIRCEALRAVAKDRSAFSIRSGEQKQSPHSATLDLTAALDGVILHLHWKGG